MMTIKFSGLDSLTKRITEYGNSIPAKSRIFLNKLSEIGLDIANVSFSQAKYDGINDVSCGVEWVEENKLRLCAEGGSVLFIEFGSGVHYGEQHPRAEELGMIRGVYGQGKGANDTWGYYYNGGQMTAGGVLQEKKKGLAVVITHGNPPSRSMYNAYAEMKDKIADVAREVFNYD